MCLGLPSLTLPSPCLLLLPAQLQAGNQREQRAGQFHGVQRVLGIVVFWTVAVEFTAAEGKFSPNFLPPKPMSRR